MAASIAGTSTPSPGALKVCAARTSPICLTPISGSIREDIGKSLWGGGWGGGGGNYPYVSTAELFA